MSKYEDSEKHKFLISEGWTYSIHHIGEDGSIPIPMYAPPDKSCLGMSVMAAYKQAVYAKEKRERDVALDDKTAKVVCNNCGGDCAKYEKWGGGEDHHVGYYGLVDAEVSGGYSSENEMICDGSIYTFSLCEDCLAKMFKAFKVPPKENRYF